MSHNRDHEVNSIKISHNFPMGGRGGGYWFGIAKPKQAFRLIKKVATDLFLVYLMEISTD